MKFICASLIVFTFVSSTFAFSASAFEGEYHVSEAICYNDGVQAPCDIAIPIYLDIKVRAQTATEPEAILLFSCFSKAAPCLEGRLSMHFSHHDAHVDSLLAVEEQGFDWEETMSFADTGTVESRIQLSYSAGNNYILRGEREVSGKIKTVITNIVKQI